MEFRKFSGTESACDNIYDDPDYEEAFFIRTKNDEVLKVSLHWEQGRYNNYRFIRGDVFSYSTKDIIWPDSVVEIEKKH